MTQTNPSTNTFQVQKQDRWSDRHLPESLIAINKELQELAHDALERDCDEPYLGEINDNWYDEQYELE